MNALVPSDLWLAPAGAGVPLVFVRAPFGADCFETRVTEPITVGEALRRVPALPDRFWSHGIVDTILPGEDGLPDSVSVPREAWERTLIDPAEPGVSILCHMSYGEFELSPVLKIASALALFAGSLVTGPLGIALTGAGLVAGLAASALSRPPTAPDAPERPEDRPFGVAGGSGRVLSAGDVIPRSIGTNRYPPPLGCQPLVEIVGENEVVEWLGVMAGPTQWQAERMKNVPLASFDGLQFQTREGFSGDSAIDLIERFGATDRPAAPELKKHEVDIASQADLADQANPANSIPSWLSMSTRRACDEAWIHLAFEGLLHGDALDATLGVPVRIRIRRPDWTNFGQLVEVHFFGRRGTLFKKAIKLIWGDPPGSPPTPPSDDGPCLAFKAVPIQDADPYGVGGWTAHDSFSAGAGNDVMSASTIGTTNVQRVHLYADRVEIYLDESAFPKDVYEVQTIRGMAYNTANFTPGTYDYGEPVNEGIDFFQYFRLSTSGSVEDGIPATTGTYRILYDQQTVRDRMQWESLASVYNVHPVQRSGLALLAIKAPNLAIDQVTALVSGYVEDWNGSTWTGDVVTSNPAPHLRDVLLGPSTQRPLPDASLLDNQSVVDWRQRAIDDGLACDLVADGQRSAEILDILTGCGYAWLAQSETIAVAQDKDRSAEGLAQIFTPRDMRNFRHEIVLPELPHGQRIADWPDKTRDYRAGPELIVYADGYSADGAGGTTVATELEEARLAGLVTEAAIVARSAHDQEQARARNKVSRFEVPATALRCRRGSTIGVVSPVLSPAFGWARLKSKSVSGGKVDSITLDAKVPTKSEGDFFSIPDLFNEDDIFALGGSTGVAVRLADGSQTVWEAEPSNDVEFTEVLTFADPKPDDDADLVEGCSVTVGALGREMERLIVRSIRHTRRLRAEIEAVPEAPHLWPAAATLTDFEESAADLAAYVFPGKSLGASAATRDIALAIAARAGSTETVDAVKVRGVSLEEIATHDVSGTRVAIWIGRVPGGATGDVEVTFSGTMVRCAIGVYRCVNLKSRTPRDTLTTGATDPLSGTLDVKRGGIAIGVAFTSTSTTAVWTGLSEDREAVVEDPYSWSAASAAFSADEAGRTIECDLDDGESLAALAAVSLR